MNKKILYQHEGQVKELYQGKKILCQANVHFSCYQKFPEWLMYFKFKKNPSLL